MDDLTSSILEELHHNKKIDVDARLKSMTDEDLNKIYEKMSSPYSFNLPGTKSYTNLSYTNVREDYAIKNITTALIGFLFRCLDEYKVPAECEPVSMEDYIKNPSIIEPREHDFIDERKMGKIKQHMEQMGNKVHIYNFLMDRFQYNPDKHVRIAYTPNPKDPERTPVDTKITRKGKRYGNSVRTRDGKLKGTRIAKINKKKMRDIRRRQEKNLEEDEKVDINNIDALSEDDTPDALIENDLETHVPKLAEDIVREVIPSADYFYFFNRYRNRHYDIFHKATMDLYNEKHDLDIAFSVHEQHDTIEEADAYRHKHKEDTPYTIYTIQNNKWIFSGPWEENRDRMEFFNKNTAVMEAIMEGNKDDAMMAKDIVNNRVRIAKEQNVEEVGPDDESFLRYKMSNRPEVARMGAININDTAYADNVDDDDTQSRNIPLVPEKEALEVDIFSLSDGGRKLTKGMLYTKAIAPDEEGGAMPISAQESYRLKNQNVE